MDSTAVQSYDKWPVEEVFRNVLVEKIATHLAAFTFFNGKVKRISDEVARQYAEEIEQAAFAAAGEKNKDSTLQPVDMIAFYAGQASQLMLSKFTTDEQEKEVVAQDETVETTELDISKGEREFLTKERTQELLQPLFKFPITKVRMSTKSFSPECAAVMAEGLLRLKESLTDVDLSDIIAGQKEEDALSTLAIISKSLEGTKLLRLDLSHNAFGAKGLRACAKALQGQTTLQHLAFCNIGGSPEACEFLRDHLLEVSDLRSLHFLNNMSGDEGAIAMAQLLKKAKNLQEIRFSSTRVGTEGGIALVEALAAGSKLEVLDLRDNMLMTETGSVLAKTLTNHMNLRELYLGDTGLGDQGVKDLVEGLRDTATNLEVLDLSGNEITKSAASAVAALLASCVNLRKIFLAENELKDKGTVLVCKGITSEHRKLEEVHLNTNEMSKVGAVTAAKVVANLPSFKLLNVNANAISSDGIDTLIEIFKKAGRVHALGSFDENDEEGGEDDEEEEEEEESKEEEEVEEGLSRLAVNK